MILWGKNGPFFHLPGLPPTANLPNPPGIAICPAFPSLSNCPQHYSRLSDTSPHFTPDGQRSSAFPFQRSSSQPTPEIPVPNVRGRAQGWLRKNREFAENVKQLQGEVDKFQDSEATKKANDERIKVRPCTQILHSKPDSVGPSLQLASSIKENLNLRAAAQELRKAGVQVGDAMSEALKSMEESEVMRAVRI